MLWFLRDFEGQLDAEVCARFARQFDKIAMRNYNVDTNQIVGG